MNRNISINGIDFTVADYRPRNNEYEKGLRYQLLIKVYDGIRECDYYYRDTGARFTTIKRARNYVKDNYWKWM